MRVLVLVGSYFPYGVAISSRMLNFCKLFSACGMDVNVLSLYSKEKDIDIRRVYNMGFCTYQVATQKGESSIASFIGEKDFISCVKRYVRENGQPDFVFASGCEPYFNRFRKILNKSLFFLEQCEWIDKSSYKFGRLDYRFIRRDTLLQGGYKKADGIISISRLLEDHYRSLGIKTIRIPTILDVQNMDYSIKTNNNRVKIVYTGNPSTSKEIFRPVFEAIREEPRIRNGLEFHIYGPSEKKVLANIGGDIKLLNDIKTSVCIHGRVPQGMIEDILKTADYQLFLRPDRRSSNAGFPTKLAESMAVGTPVITNATGDIGLYLKDGKNGFIASGIGISDVKLLLKRVLTMECHSMEQMRYAARKTAEEFFDFRRYADEINILFSGHKEHTNGEIDYD